MVADPSCRDLGRLGAGPTFPAAPPAPTEEPNVRTGYANQRAGPCPAGPTFPPPGRRPGRRPRRSLTSGRAMPTSAPGRARRHETREAAVSVRQLRLVRILRVALPIVFFAFVVVIYLNWP